MEITDITEIYSQQTASKDISWTLQLWAYLFYKKALDNTYLNGRTLNTSNAKGNSSIMDLIIGVIFQ